MRSLSEVGRLVRPQSKRSEDGAQAVKAEAGKEGLLHKGTAWLHLGAQVQTSRQEGT